MQLAVTNVPLTRVRHDPGILSWFLGFFMEGLSGGPENAGLFHIWSISGVLAVCKARYEPLIQIDSHINAFV